MASPVLESRHNLNRSVIVDIRPGDVTVTVKQMLALSPAKLGTTEELQSILDRIAMADLGTAIVQAEIAAGVHSYKSWSVLCERVDRSH